MADQPSPPPRRPFEGRPEPEPFHRTPEFQRFLWLAGALVMVLLLALYFAWRAQGGGSPPAPPKPAPAPLLGQAEVAAREARLVTLFEGSLQDTLNGDGFIETTGYRRLLQILMSYPPEEVSRRATRHLDYAAAVADPDAWRGEFVWVRGIVAYLYAEKLRDPVFGLQDVYQGVLTEADASEGIVFDMIEPPPSVDRRREAVDVEGIFYRTLRYEGQDGKAKVVPYLLVRNLRPVQEAASDSGGFLRDHTAALFVGLALAILAARLLMYAFQRRRRPSRRAAAARAAGPDIRDLIGKKIHEGGREPGSRA